MPGIEAALDFAPAPVPPAEPSFTGSSRLAEVKRPEMDEGNPALAEAVYEALKSVRDPEIPVNLVDLGLIYEIAAREDGLVYIEMTLTTPACPVAGSLPGQVQQTAASVPGASIVLVKLVWTPPWTQDRMTPEAKLELGLL